MMTNSPRLLLTSFAVWRDDQPSNASDDLLGLWSAQQPPDALARVQCLRQLPVHTERASARICATIGRDRPDFVLCCGMAEARTELELETNAKHDGTVLYSRANLSLWARGLSRTRLSHDAGSFVCNGTYFRVLQDIRDRDFTTQCTFVHVPILNAANTAAIVQDFDAIVQRLLFSRDLMRSQPNAAAPST
ncbi:MAG: peptidase C15 [Cyanobacteria bacterium J06639_1]